ncbi:MAG: phenylacetate--CoA ligase [Oscillospiraceae bacterium]|jgi:phenylacetate-CoA ligase|nr:phenylacetate--CoA ligase [Oscillospiraceae bacterium]
MAKKETKHLIWDKTAECMSRDELRAHQDQKLRLLVKRVYANVPFYRAKMHALGVQPGDIRGVEDLHLLPFTEKTDLRDNYPFGLFAVPQSQIVRIHASSGTTGKPTVVGYTAGDIDMWAELMARSLTAAGITKDSIVQVAYGYGLFTGGLGAHYGAERIGASVIPMSGGNTQKQVMLMQDFGSTALACTPSYAMVIGEMVQEMGIPLSNLKMQSGVFGAEPWTEGTRRRIEELLGITAQDVYGLSEVMGPGVSMECPVQEGMHIWEDHFVAEVLNPETGAPMPYGERGELVFTTLTKEGLPLLRYRTHDLTVLDDSPCPCGRTHVRMRKLVGRTDDMLIIRGVNVFPSQVEGVLAALPGVSPHFLMVVDTKNNMDTLELRVELTPEMMSDTVRDVESLQKKMDANLTSVLGLHAAIRLVPPGSIPRSQGKAVRVQDNRSKE